jgi:hypothetical protein
MKKTFLLLCGFLLYLITSGQKAIATITPCTDAMAHTIKGRWIWRNDNGSHNSKETTSRLNKIHEMVLQIYPQPTGLDAVWHRTAGMSYFGAKRKYYNTNDGSLTFDYSNLPHFTYYYYNVGFFPYQCEYGKTNSIIPTYPGETSTFLNIIANAKLGDMAPDDTWITNGLPVLMRKPSIRIKEGIELSHPEPGRNVYEVLVHRKGVLPYTPVTRKQYLEYCITYHTKLHDELIKHFEQMPVRSTEEQEKEKKAKLDKFQKEFGNDPKKLKTNVDYYLSGYQTDQQRRDEQVVKAKKIKEDELKKFTDELEKTTSEGLLDSPAMVLVKYYSIPSVFETDPARGSILVTENPEYVRRDLPKHVPQFFIVALTWKEGAPQKFAETFQQNFPFEKLQ